MNKKLNLSGYSLVDVSETVLDQLKQRLEKSVPQLSIQSIHAKYEAALDQLGQTALRKVYLFMGANIGNFFSVKGATHFVKTILPILCDREISY
ncbi:MAG: L-histidine N(alpha)-methyltransferase [Cytophagales bacterium]|nr:L-histidine N(alpha)-methyltransferase [Cytophagales bacterium]